jgi:hypothetical protein
MAPALALYRRAVRLQRDEPDEPAAAAVPEAG